MIKLNYHKESGKDLFLLKDKLKCSTHIKVNGKLVDLVIQL